MAAELHVTPSRATDADSRVYAGAKWIFYSTGTTTPLNVYADADLSTSLGHIVSADSGGMFPNIYMDASLSYRGICENASGSTTLHDIDPINTGSLAALSASDGAGNVGFSHAETYPAGTLGAKGKDVISVKDAPYNAVGDGVTDDRAAIAAAVAAARGKTLYFPEGNYVINTDGGSITLQEVNLTGETVLDGANATIDQGANLLITGTTNGAFKVRRGTTVKGLGFFYPNQVDSLTPTAYPALFDFDFADGPVQFVQFTRNVVYNAYKIMDIDNGATGAVGHVEISDNYLCGINRGIYIRCNREAIRIERNNFTFGFWLAATDALTRTYMRANAIALKYDEGDGLEINGNLFFGNLIAIYAATAGNCLFTLIAGNKFDQCRYPVRAEGAGNFSGVIANNVFNAFNGADTAAAANSIAVSTTGTDPETIEIVGNHLLACTENSIITSGNNPASRSLNITGNQFVSWAAYKSSGSYAAANLNGTTTRATISGNTFVGENNTAYSVGISGTFLSANITGNSFHGCQTPISINVTALSGSGNSSTATGGATSDVVIATTNWWTGNHFDKPSATTTRPAFLARQTGAVTYNSGTATDASWNVETFDKGSNFATPTFTAPVAGRYRFTWSMMHDNTGTAGDRWAILLTTSGGNFSKSYKMIADYDSVSGEALVELAAGGTAVLKVQRVSGAGNFVTHTDGDYNYFAGMLVE